MLEAVEAATKKVIELGYADPKHIGLNGHSYGGEGAAFIATRSRMFAAVGVGAGVTDLYTDFAQSWGWSYQNTGGHRAQNGLDYYIYGQGRWGFSPWDKPDVYHFESSLTHVPEATAAILIMHGTADPTVSFMEGLKFYTALRYNKKDATMLAYPNEAARPARPRQPAGPDDPVLPVHGSLSQGRAGAEVDDGGRAIPGQGRDHRGEMTTVRLRAMRWLRGTSCTSSPTRTGTDRCGPTGARRRHRRTDRHRAAW